MVGRVSPIRIRVKLKQSYTNTKIVALDNLTRLGSEVNIQRLRKYGRVMGVFMEIATRVLKYVTFVTLSITIRTPDFFITTQIVIFSQFFVIIVRQLSPSLLLLSPSLGTRQYGKLQLHFVFGIKTIAYLSCLTVHCLITPSEYWHVGGWVNCYQKTNIRRVCVCNLNYNFGIIVVL